MTFQMRAQGLGKTTYVNFNSTQTYNFTLIQRLWKNAFSSKYIVKKMTFVKFSNFDKIFLHFLILLLINLNQLGASLKSGPP